MKPTSTVKIAVHTGPRLLSTHNLAKLDEEHFQRIREIWQTSQSKSIELSDIISSKDAFAALSKPKVLLSNFDISDIYANYPVAHRLFVQLCPKCIREENITEAVQILKSSDIVPVLIGDYVDYPKALITAVLRQPHISRHESWLYRSVRMISIAEKMVCRHCISEREEAMFKVASRYDRNGALKKIIKDTLEQLHPCIDSDFELVEVLRSAVEGNDVEAMMALNGASYTIEALRTCQALGARCTLEVTYVLASAKGAKHLLLRQDDADLSKLTTGIAESCSLRFDPALRPQEFFEIAGSYRDEIAGIVDGVLSEAKSGSGISISKLTARVGELNAEIGRLKSNNRFLGYRAAFGFLKTNRAYVGTALVAGTLGLAGSLVGCGAAVATGVLGKVLRSKGKLKAPPEIRTFLDGVKKSIRPKLHQVLASYTGISLQAVQLHEISREIQEKVKRKTAFRPKK